jgi:hypothetical protein
VLSGDPAVGLDGGCEAGVVLPCAVLDGTAGAGPVAPAVGAAAVCVGAAAPVPAALAAVEPPVAGWDRGDELGAETDCALGLGPDAGSRGGAAEPGVARPDGIFGAGGRGAAGTAGAGTLGTTGGGAGMTSCTAGAPASAPAKACTAAALGNGAGEVTPGARATSEYELITTGTVWRTRLTRLVTTTVREPATRPRGPVAVALAPTLGPVLTAAARRGARVGAIGSGKRAIASSIAGSGRASTSAGASSTSTPAASDPTYGISIAIVPITASR